MQSRNQLHTQRLIPGELYVFHHMDPTCPATSSLFGIFGGEDPDAVYLESCSPNMFHFRLKCRLPKSYCYCRLATRSELRDYTFNLACREFEIRLAGRNLSLR